ncbi:probable disease resistance protein At1g59620 isoform X2 [Salvia miltiorrhiza]|uniref:probable disease resistance protein At1g59620 isoform X2 n=1 Tax=Salvia miltiorrhiza TaxID=226208 RepID=UPI0025AD25F6|nr:probable disease resistance protein At1g59620 isoform X2 [Salvia miltiorrhiza]
MSEALLLSLIQKLEDKPNEDETDEDGTDEDGDETDEDVDETILVFLNEQIENIIKEIREIVDIVRDKKLEEGRTLNFLVCDLVGMADDALRIFRFGKSIGSCYKDDYESIHRWIGEIKKQMLKLGDDESNMRSSENVEDDVDVVGFEEDLEMLVLGSIVGGELWLKNVLIIGMAGIGKTTLAREIFNHPTVKEQFERRAWVSNSTYFTLKELLIKLIQQVAVEDPENLHTSSSLEDMDNRSLRGRGSRLLVTSHTKHMDLHVDKEDFHKMKALESKKSWQLFLKTINHGNKLTGDHKFPMDLEHMGKQMLRKCGGLPLAIKEVGKQLAEKKVSGESEWEELLVSVDFGSTLKLLEPFYQKLDPKLDPCFMCMSFFKENTTLRAEKLKQIWNAVGVVDYEKNCKPYLDGLVNESVIDVKEKSTEYAMNVVLHMLSIQKAEEKLGFEILRNNGNNRPCESPRYHRVIICSRDKFNYSTDQDKHLVSLFFHGGGFFDTSPCYWKSFEQRLRILDLEDFGLKFLPETIGKLMELRYLGLRNNYLQELPDSLGCLEKLEVLDIAQNFMVEVPDIIWKMSKLHHLYLFDVISRNPLKIEALQYLETLTYVSVDNWTYELSRLRMLARLHKLGIEEFDGNSDVSKLFVSLAVLEGLDHLILRGYRFRSMPCLDELAILQRLKTLKLDGLLARLPNNLPLNIESLTLVNSCLDEDPMPLLEKLPKLEYLKLLNAYTGQEMVILHHGFPRLKVLCLKELWNLRNIQCGKDAMYWLMKLEIYDCPYLDILPEAIERMNMLKELKMVTTKNIAAKIMNSDLISEIVLVNINP